MDALMSKARDRGELETRRLEGGRLLQRGVKPPEVARRLKVSRTSVWRWELALKANGRPPQLTGAGKKQLAEALEAGALAQGYATGLWTLARAGKLIEKISGKPVSGVRRVAAA
jgi:transposase